MPKEKPVTNRTEVLLEEISLKLDRILYAMALEAMKNKQQKDQIALLSEFGYQPKDIARLLNTTSNTVSVTLSQIRKKRTKETDAQTVVD